MQKQSSENQSRRDCFASAWLKENCCLCLKGRIMKCKSTNQLCLTYPAALALPCFTAVLCTHRIAEAGLRCRQQKLNKYLEAVKLCRTISEVTHAFIESYFNCIFFVFFFTISRENTKINMTK